MALIGDLPRVGAGPHLYEEGLNADVDLAIDGKPPPFRAAKPGGGTPEVVLERLITSGMGVPGCGVGTGEGLTEGAMDAESSLSLM